MSDPTNERHPSTMTEEDKKALRDSDPAAFEDDEAGSSSENGGSGAGAAEGAGAGTGKAGGDAGGSAGVDDAGGNDAGKEGGDAAANGNGAADAGKDEGEGQGAEGAAADADKAGKAPPAAVPRARLDEVIAQRNEAETLALQQARELALLKEQLAKLQAQPPKDFDSEYDRVQKQYDEGEIDLEERDKEFRRLQREEFTHIANIQAVQAQASTTEAAVERSWNDDVAAWSKKNPGFLEAEGNAQVMDRAIQSVAAFHGPTLTNSELLEEASKLAFKATGYVPPASAAAPAPAPADAGAQAAAGRRAQNAARAADASGAPPPITGGVGGRGGPDNGVDLTNLKPGSFSKKLSAAEQEKLLGEGAL